VIKLGCDEFYNIEQFPEAKENGREENLNDWRTNTGVIQYMLSFYFQF
jgi:hypothetical protein